MNPNKKGYRCKIDPECLKKYVRDHPKATMKDIAADFGCCVRTVQVSIRCYGIDYIGKKGARRKVDPEVLRKYVQKHPDATLRAIAATFDCDVHAIHWAIKRHNISYTNKSTATRHLSPPHIEAYILNHPKASVKQIAAAFHCGYQSIYTLIKRHNISYIKKRSSLPPERLREYIRNNPAATLCEIAVFFSCTPDTLSATIKANKIPYVKKKHKHVGVKSPQKLFPEPLRAYVEAHPSATQREIAEFFGCSRNAVSMALRAYGIRYVNKLNNKRSSN